MQMNEYQSMQYQNDIIKFKIQIRELEVNLGQKEKELKTKVDALKSQHEKEMRQKTLDFESQIKNTANTVKAL